MPIGYIVWCWKYDSATVAVFADSPKEAMDLAVEEYFEGFGHEDLNVERCSRLDDIPRPNHYVMGFEGDDLYELAKRGWRGMKLEGEVKRIDDSNHESEEFDITIGRKETKNMCEDTIKFSKNCRKYISRSRTYGDRYEFPVGSIIRLNGTEMVVKEASPYTVCQGCLLDGPHLHDIGRFEASMMCVNTACAAKLRKDGRNTQYRLKKKKEEQE